MDQRDYTLWLVKGNVPPPEGAVNVMRLPGDNEWMAVIVRIYRPDQGVNDLGGVPLPTIEALRQDMSLGQLPEVSLDRTTILEIGALGLLGKLSETRNTLLRVNGDDQVAFLRIPDQGLFPNADTEYIMY